MHMLVWRLLWRVLVALSLVSSWLGMVYFAQDFQGREEALKAWESFMPVSPTTALVIFSGLLLAWVVWIDLRPLILPEVRKRAPWLFRDSGRISFVELGELAQKYGWKLGGNSLQSLDLVEAIRQGAIDGDLQIEGRIEAHHMGEHLKRSTPLYPIRGAQFVNEWIEVPGYFAGTNNFHIRTYVPGGQSVMDACDLHVSSAYAARKWLLGKAKDWKGLNQKQQDELTARQADALAQQSPLSIEAGKPQ